MARKTSSKPDSGSLSTATIGFEPTSTPSRTLAPLRNTLLPKLLSGELSVAGLANTETALSIGPAWLDEQGDVLVCIDDRVFRAGEKYTFLEMGWAVYQPEDAVPAEWMRKHGETRPAEEGWNKLASSETMLVTSHPILVAMSLRAWWHRNGRAVPTAPKVKIPDFAEAVEEVRQREILNNFNHRHAGTVPGTRRWQPAKS